MLQTGNYTVHGALLTNFGCMTYSRAQAAFRVKAFKFPNLTSESDIHQMIFNRSQRMDLFRTDTDTSADIAALRANPGRDPFLSGDEYVWLDRSDTEPESPARPARATIHREHSSERRGESQSSSNTHSRGESTEVRSNSSASAARTPSLYEILHSYTNTTDTAVDISPDEPDTAADTYSDIAIALACDTSRRQPTTSQLRDPRMPPFFVQRTPGLHSAAFIRSQERSDPSVSTSTVPQTASERQLDEEELGHSP